jgi:hypothetical protein
MGGPWEQYQKSPPGPWTSFQPQPEKPIDTSGIDAEDISAVTGKSAQGGKPWDRAIAAKDGEIAKRALGDAGYTDYSNPKNLVDRYEGEKKRRAGEPNLKPADRRAEEMARSPLDNSEIQADSELGRVGIKFWQRIRALALAAAGPSKV